MKPSLHTIKCLLEFEESPNMSFNDFPVAGLAPVRGTNPVFCLMSARIGELVEIHRLANIRIGPQAVTIDDIAPFVRSRQNDYGLAE